MFEEKASRVEDIVGTLRARYGNCYTTIQYRLWAEMVDIEMHRLGWFAVLTCIHEFVVWQVVPFSTLLPCYVGWQMILQVLLLSLGVGDAEQVRWLLSFLRWPRWQRFCHHHLPSRCLLQACRGARVWQQFQPQDLVVYLYPLQSWQAFAAATCSRCGICPLFECGAISESELREQKAPILEQLQKLVPDWRNSVKC